MEETAVSTPVESTPAAESAPAAAFETPSAAIEGTGSTPQNTQDDPFASLESAMDALMPQDDPANPQDQPQDGQNAPIPEQFQQALEISEFVKSPEGVQQAVRAADEVWKVATGQIPARQMLEGFKATNPQQYQAIVSDLANYISSVTGQQFGGQAQPSPLDALKEANPQAYQQFAEWYQQTMGKPVDGAVDPRDARISALEEHYAKEERQRQEAQFQQQAQVANTKAMEFLTSKLKGTFAEGSEAHFIGLLAQQLGPKGVEASMKEVLAGNTKSLEKALKEVQKSEVARLKAYNANLIKQSRAIRSAVPLSGAPVQNKATSPEMSKAPLEGESPYDHFKRLEKNGLLT